MRWYFRIITTYSKAGKAVNTHEPYRIAVLTYLASLEEMMCDYCNASDFTLDFFKISYDKIIQDAQRLLSEGYEAIICYSAFGHSLLKEIGHSIVLLQKTDTDTIKALQYARRFTAKVGLTVAKDDYVDVNYLDELLNMRIHAISYTTVEDLRECIRVSVDAGLGALVGGGFSALMASLHQIECVVITPNAYSIRIAVEQAVATAKARRKERESTERILSILRHFREGVVCVSQDGDILFQNAKILDLFKITRTKRQVDSLQRFFAPLQITDVLQDGMAREEQVVRINNELFLVTTLPISIHADLQCAVAFITDINSLQNISGRIRAIQKKNGFTAHYEVEDILGQTPEMERLRKMINLYAVHGSAVYIHGESGTGKELVAQALHNLSPRRENPFVALNCAALPESLLESELFGYAEGAFTGARRGGKPGVFEMAHKGTLFLDEVGEMGHSTQLRLLRVLETKELVRVGGDHVIPVDIRIISASHKSLANLVHQGGFRHDLFYRLASLRLHVPPLSERLADIPILVQSVLKKYGKTIHELSPPFQKLLHNTPWPGNIREIMAFMESYLIVLGDRSMDKDLFVELLQEWTSGHVAVTSPASSNSVGSGKMKDQLDLSRRDLAWKTVQDCGGKKREAAERLNISYNTLWRILSKHEPRG